MKRIALVVLLVACGKENKAKDDAAPPAIDAPTIDAPTDAPSLATCPNPASGTTIRLRRFGERVVGAALLATSPPGDERLFVIEQRGAIRIFQPDETLLPDPFLDLSGDAGGPVLAGGEQGLLGLAFHPQYAANGQFFVFYTKRQVPADSLHPIRDVLARCQRSANDPDRAEPTCVEVLSIKDAFSNHNGGMIEFGSDGLLYIGTGDGGSGGDPDGNGQTLVDGAPAARSVALLGKMLRIDVDNKAAGKEYGIPSDNPFAAGGGAPEIFQLGLRNPWRWSFDRVTGDMWIGDVGQGALEEIDVVKAADLKGVNFGWDMFEGSNCFTDPCTTAGKTFAKDERRRSDGWAAIIGGQVYRGTCYPDIVGTYFYADNAGRKYAKATLNGDGTLTKSDLAPAAGEPAFPSGPASIHEDARGELFVTTTAGDIFHIEAGPP
jgi:glucose/arabinose dehydrogenase